MQHETHYIQPTSSPPVRTTTLRTIIKPDSEIYHSNSGIQVTFNTENKHQTGHEYQEHYEESALQPIITDIRSPAIDHSRSSATHFNHPPLGSNQPFGNNDRARAFEIQYTTNHAQNIGSQQAHVSSPISSPSFHRFGPPSELPHFNSPQFLRPTPDQGLLLSYTHNQANRLLQSQNIENRIKNTSPSSVPNNQANHRFPEPPVLNFSPPLSGPVKFRPQTANHQSKPIPIPIHHHEKSQQTQINQNQHYTNYKQFRAKPQSHQNILFQQSFPQPVRSNSAHLHQLAHGKNYLSSTAFLQMNIPTHINSNLLLLAFSF